MSTSMIVTVAACVAAFAFIVFMFIITDRMQTFMQSCLDWEYKACTLSAAGKQPPPLPRAGWIVRSIGSLPVWVQNMAHSMVRSGYPTMYHAFYNERIES